MTAHSSASGARTTQMSAVEVPVNQIKTIPAMGGEVDVIKALQLLPGVQSGTEGTAGIYVRGGGADENLLLMDGVPLYNVSHLYGFFSIFNAGALKNVTLYKGSFPARFGGHLSSVIDVRMNDGNYDDLGAGYDFYDINAKITHRFNNGDRLSLSVYDGDDRAHVKTDDASSYENLSFNPLTWEIMHTGIRSYSHQTSDLKWRWCLRG